MTIKNLCGGKACNVANPVKTFSCQGWNRLGLFLNQNKLSHFHQMFWFNFTTKKIMTMIPHENGVEVWKENGKKATVYYFVTNWRQWCIKEI